ncbi:unnamed protein product [Ectocarpus sp. 6 AP-2014]
MQVRDELGDTGFARVVAAQDDKQNKKNDISSTARGRSKVFSCQSFRNYSASEERLMQFQGDGGRSKSSNGAILFDMDLPYLTAIYFPRGFFCDKICKFCKRRFAATSSPRLIGIGIVGEECNEIVRSGFFSVIVWRGRLYWVLLSCII